MVRISRSRLVQPRRRRRHGGGPLLGSSASLLPPALLLSLLVGGGVLVVWTATTSSSSASTSSSSSSSFNYDSSSLRRQQQEAPARRHILRQDDHHPDSYEEQQEIPNVDQYDALAADLWSYLRCDSLLNVTRYQDVWNSDKESENTNNNNNNSNQDWRDDDTDTARRLQDAALNPHGPKDDDNDDGIGNDNLLFADLQDDDWIRRNGGAAYGDVVPTAQHLLCLAATPAPRNGHAAAGDDDAAPTDPHHVRTWQRRLQCPVTTDPLTRRALLDIWNEARSHFQSQQQQPPPHNDAATAARSDLLTYVLSHAVEQPMVNLVGRAMVHLWDMTADQGLDYVVRTMAHANASHTADQGGLYGLGHNLGPGRTFVDVGSGLGVVSMAMALLYPGTRIVSVEVAAPNWLLQSLNWRCNAATVPQTFDQTDVEDNPLLLWAGVGPDARHASVGQFLWKPSLVTATRPWGPASERNPDEDVELTVHLEAWHALAARAGLTTAQGQTDIDVLYLDCGACEYNFIPALSEAEFERIATVLGQMHWGYIPPSRLPSSDRGRSTHARLCRHENFARTAKECCDVPDVIVKASYPDQVLLVGRGDDATEVDDVQRGGLPQPGTVADVAGDFCNDFADWAVEKHLHDVPNDLGWFQISPVAEGY